MLEDTAHPPQQIAASRRYAQALSKQGVDTQFLLVPPAHEHLFTRLGDRSITVRLIKHFMGVKEPGRFDRILDGYRQWRSPLFDNNAFLAQPSLLKTYPADDGLRSMIKLFFHNEGYQLKQWPLAEYQAIDLLELAQGRRFVQLGNRLGQKVYLDLDRYAQYQPQIVVSIDDETNLYQLKLFYQTRQQYSWIDDGPRPALSVRPLGAFLHFRKPPPRVDWVPLLLRANLVYDQITFADEDPLAKLDQLPDKAEHIVLTNCVRCHSIEQVGGRAHHVVAATGEAQPGLALPLESYSRDVMRNFLFNQAEVARKIGVKPNGMPEDVARELFEWLHGRKLDASLPE